MSQVQHKPLIFDTFEEFLVWERLQPTKHDLIDGVPVAMAGAGEGHNIIAGNIYFVARLKLGGDNPCRPFQSDMITKTGVNKGRYPDVTIDCGQRNVANQSAPKPVVIFEVLSPKTQKQDRTVKLAEYNAVPTIAHYVLVEQSEPLVHVYSRGGTGDFIIRPEEIEGLEGSLDLPAIGISMSMSEIYENIDFGDTVSVEPPPPLPWVR